MDSTMFAIRRGFTDLPARVAWTLGLAMLLAGTSAPAAPPRARVIAQSDNDCTLTALARQALLDDVELGLLNLGVSVNDHVATVWGPVPSQASARRAVECVRRVQGISRVVDQLSVEPPQDPLFDFLKLPPRSLDLRKPGFQAGPDVRPPGDVDKTRTRTSLGPASLPSRSVLDDARPAGAQGKPGAQSASLAEVPAMPSLVLPVAAPAVGDLPHEVAALQEKNARLRYVHAEVQAGVVSLRGFVYSWEDLFALARSIALLPGVERVVIRDVKMAGR
jgi:hypothetical protein